MKTNNLLVLIVVINMFGSMNIHAGEKLEQLNPQTLIYGMPYDFAEYSVYTANSYATAQWQSAVYTGLYKRSAAAELDWVPDMAESLPSVTEALRTFTIQIRQDLVFSNGEAVTADDVIFSYKVALTPGINTNFYRVYSGFMNNDSVVKLGELEVVITLDQTFAFPFTFLSTPIIPEETYGDRYESCVDNGVAADCTWNNPNLSDAIAAGPYVATSYDDTNQIITLEKNPYYYDWDVSTGNIETLIFIKTTEKTAAVAELADGGIDIMDSQYIPGIDELTFLPNVKESYVGDPAHQEISLNHVHPHFGTGNDIPGNDAATEAQKLADALLVRKAMSHIVDREFAATEIADGLAIPAATSMPSAALGWDPSIPYREFGIEESKLLMTQAGYDYGSLTDSDNDGTYETFFFKIDVMSPNSCCAKNEWSAAYVLELPKIGIGVVEHHSVGWDIIIPRTFGYPVATATGYFDADGNDGLVPLWDDGGYDILFVGYGWALDWNPQGLYDSSGSHATADGRNYYNFDLNRDEAVKSNV